MRSEPRNAVSSPESSVDKQIRFSDEARWRAPPLPRIDILKASGASTDAGYNNTHKPEQKSRNCNAQFPNLLSLRKYAIREQYIFRLWVK
jgi:hypothetical protein